VNAQVVSLSSTDSMTKTILILIAASLCLAPPALAAEPAAPSE